MRAVKTKVPTFLLGVRERSRHKVFLNENAHAGVPFSSLECLITNSPRGLWVVALGNKEYSATDVPQHTLWEPFRPKFLLC